MDFITIVESKKSFEETVIALLQSIEKNGWTIFGIYDIAERTSAKGFRHKNIKVIELCKAPYADMVLKCNKAISACLPCRISVFEDNGVKISFVNPTAMAEVFGIPREDVEQIEKDLLKIMELG